MKKDWVGEEEKESMRWEIGFIEEEKKIQTRKMKNHFLDSVCNESIRSFYLKLAGEVIFAEIG